MNILYLPFSILLGYLYILIGLLFIILHWIWRYWDNIKNYCPEALIFKNARQKGIATMQKWYMNGFFVFGYLEKDKKGDMYINPPDDTHEGIRFDPRMQSKTPKCSTVNGLEVYQYGSNTPYNLTVLNAVSMEQTVKHIRDNYKELDFLTPEILIEFCQKDKNVLINDCLNIVSIYNTSKNLDLPFDKVTAIKEKLKEDMYDKFGPDSEESFINIEVEKEYIIQIQKIKAENLAEKFIKIQDELIKIDIKPNYFSFANAFQYMSSCATSIDIQAYKNMIDRLHDLKREQFDMKFLIIVGFAVMLILIGAGIFYTLTG